MVCGSATLRLERASASPGGLAGTHTARLAPRASDSAGLGWGATICISNEIPRSAAASGLRTIL